MRPVSHLDTQVGSLDCVGVGGESPNLHSLAVKQFQRSSSDFHTVMPLTIDIRMLALNSCFFMSLFCLSLITRDNLVVLLTTSFMILQMVLMTPFWGERGVIEGRVWWEGRAWDNEKREKMIERDRCREE